MMFLALRRKLVIFLNKEIMFDNPTLKNKCSLSIAEEQEEISVKTIESNIGANFTKVFNGLNLKVYPKRSLKKVNYRNKENNEEMVQESEPDYINESQDEDSENFDSDEKRDLSSKSKPRKWTAKQVEALNSYFGDFIFGRISDWPTRKEIEGFRIKNAIDFPYSKIRSKLVNDREKNRRQISIRTKLSNKRCQDMNM
ncbi:uncharacterized protein LOC124809955 isoform X2 [Hydra vulgaris]|uniref:Uncharacterized protein LOC124809955 isoform X2 n=1 Tax=Hydra vulgaris TaxID=6087 RepID=A0ABM4B3E9_HYDVU